MYLEAYEKCPLCSGQTHSYPQSGHQLMVCPHCDHHFLQMARSEKLDIKALYEQENYYSDCGGSGMTSEGYIQNRLNDGLSRFYFKIRLAELANFIPANEKINYLDYGSSAGQIVAMARDELGWASTGIDLSPTSVECANKLGIDVRQGDIELLMSEQRQYDAISLYHCLEHVIHPGELLLKMRTILKPKGLIAIEVPNIYSAIAKFKGKKWKGLLLPYHIHHFHESTLVRLLESCGYEIEKSWTPYYPQATSQILSLSKIYQKVRKRKKSNKREVMAQLTSVPRTTKTYREGQDKALTALYYPFDKSIAMLGMGEALSVIARKIG